MTTAAALKQSICEAIDRNAEQHHRPGRAHPPPAELGFKEFKTARLVEETLSELGLTAAGRPRAHRRARRGRGRQGRPDLRAAGRAGRPRGGRASDRRSRRPAPRTPAATTPRWRGSSAPRWGSARRSAFEHLAGRVVFFAVPAGGIRRRRVARAAGARGPARVPRRQARAAPPRPLRRRGPRHDDPHHVAARHEEGGRGRLQQRLPREDGPLHRPRLPRGRRAAHGDQRALRRQHRPLRDQRASARPSATRTPSACTRSSPTAAAR